MGGQLAKCLSKDFASALEQELSEQLCVRENGVRTSMTKLRIVAKQIVKQAITGDHVALRQLFLLLTGPLGQIQTPRNLDLQELSNEELDEIIRGYVNSCALEEVSNENVPVAVKSDHLCAEGD